MLPRSWAHPAAVRTRGPGFKQVVRLRLNHMTPCAPCMFTHSCAYVVRSRSACAHVPPPGSTHVLRLLPCARLCARPAHHLLLPHQCMSRPQPLQWEYVSGLIPPPTLMEVWQDTRGNHTALCVPDLCTGLLSVLTVKPTQELWHRLQRGPNTVHLKLNTAL